MARVTEPGARLPADRPGAKRKPQSAVPPGGGGSPPAKKKPPAGPPYGQPPYFTPPPGQQDYGSGPSHLGHGAVLPGDEDYTNPPPVGDPNQPPGQPQDHSDLLGIYGLPPDVAAQVDAIFRQYPNDPNAAAQAAIAYIRGTQWYAQTFPGIAQARAIGFIGTDLGSEREYRQYYMQYNQLYQQYYKRNMTWDEANRLFSQGVTPDFLGKQFFAGAYVGANRNDIQYLAGAFTDQGRLSGGQLQTYGEEVAGIDSPLGQILKQKLDQAQAKLQTIFSGTLATPSLTLGGAGLSAPNLLGTKTTQQPDVPA